MSDINRKIRITEMLFIRETTSAPRPDLNKRARIMADITTILGFYGWKVVRRNAPPVVSGASSAIAQMWAMKDRKDITVSLMVSTLGVKVTCTLPINSISLVFTDNVYIKTVRFVERMIGEGQ